jgi:hypothetical protein
MFQYTHKAPTYHPPALEKYPAPRSSRFGDDHAPFYHFRALGSRAAAGGNAWRPPLLPTPNNGRVLSLGFWRHVYSLGVGVMHGKLVGETQHAALLRGIALVCVQICM